MDPGFKRRQRRDRIYDKLHKGFVNVCISVTVVTGVVLGYKVYEYFRYIRPLHMAQTKITDEELLREGRSIDDSSNVQPSV